MFLLGALANGLEASLGGVIGMLLRRRVSKDLGAFLLKGQGLAVVLVAVQGMTQDGSVVVVTLAMALGCLVGYWADIDARVRALGSWAQGRLDRALAGSGRLGDFSEGFVTATLFCCTGAMAIVGSLRSGLELDHATLVAKGLIDLVVCIPLAATLGAGVPFVGVSLVVYEGLLSGLAAALGGLLSDAVVTQMSVTGSLLLLAVGTNLLGVTDIKVADMLPAAFLPIVLVPLLQLAGLA